MDEPPRWSAKTAVKKDDQFTAAPDFIDVHESDHLPLWGRIQASWHGMSGTRRVVVMASMALLATWGGTSAIYFLDDLDGVVGSPDPNGGVAAEQDKGPVDGLPDVDPELLPQSPGSAGSPGSTGSLNATTTSVPVLPAQPPGP